jgi:GNAT superfamily N-acetyltransferase
VSEGDTAQELVVRVAVPADIRYAERASELIRAAAREHDIAEREPELLARKIETGRAAVALSEGLLVGFGFFSEWEDGAFVSHSGLVVRDDWRGKGLGRALKTCLFEASDAMFPEATTMSLTTSEAVKAMNLSLGFLVVPLDRLTVDEAFWDGCKTCRNYERVQREGGRCCCEGMIRVPPGRS